jgi:hypothetical protein
MTSLLSAMVALPLGACSQPKVQELFRRYENICIVKVLSVEEGEEQLPSERTATTLAEKSRRYRRARLQLVTLLKGSGCPTEVRHEGTVTTYTRRALPFQPFSEKMTWSQYSLRSSPDCCGASLRRTPMGAELVLFSDAEARSHWQTLPLSDAVKHRRVQREFSRANFMVNLRQYRSRPCTRSWNQSNHRRDDL